MIARKVFAIVMLCFVLVGRSNGAAKNAYERAISFGNSLATGSACYLEDGRLLLREPCYNGSPLACPTSFVQYDYSVLPEGEHLKITVIDMPCKEAMRSGMGAYDGSNELTNKTITLGIKNSKWVGLLRLESDKVKKGRNEAPPGERTGTLLFEVRDEAKRVICKDRLEVLIPVAMAHISVGSVSGCHCPEIALEYMEYGYYSGVVYSCAPERFRCLASARAKLEEYVAKRWKANPGADISADCQFIWQYVKENPELAGH